MNRRMGNAVVGLTLAASIAGYLQLAWKPARAERAALAVRLDRVESEISRSEQFTAGVADLQRYLAEFEDALTSLDRMVPERIDEDDLIQDATTVLSDCGLREDSIRRGEPAPQDGVTAHSIHVVASGSYKDLVRFLFAVEALPRYTRVTEISIERAVDRPNMVRASLDVTSYSIRPGGAG